MATPLLIERIAAIIDPAPSMSAAAEPNATSAMAKATIAGFRLLRRLRPFCGSWRRANDLSVAPSPSVANLWIGWQTSLSAGVRKQVGSAHWMERLVVSH